MSFELGTIKAVFLQNRCRVKHPQWLSTRNSSVLAVITLTRSIQLASVPWSLRVTKFPLCLCPSGVCHDLRHYDPKRDIFHRVSIYEIYKTCCLCPTFPLYQACIIVFDFLFCFFLHRMQALGCVASWGYSRPCYSALTWGWHMRFAGLLVSQWC